MSERPIFYDASGRRRRRFALGIAAFAALLLLAVAVFAVSIGAVPAAPLLPVAPEHPALKSLPAPRGGLLGRTTRSINYYAAQLFGTPVTAPKGHSVAPSTPAPTNPALAIAFHAPWDESSAASLARHVEQLDWLIPAGYR